MANAKRPTHATRSDGRHCLLVPLASGEIDLIRRALRTYMCAEQQAIQTAACARDPAHHADVKRQVMPRIEVAGELLDRLLKNPTDVPKE